MQTLVMNFGGAAVSTPAHFEKIATIIEKRSRQCQRILVVVSAMGNMTDELIDLAKKVHHTPPRRELDMLVSVGERISISLLAMALDVIGKEALSFTGSQSGIITTAEHAEARIIEVRPWRLLPHMEMGKIVIVAGFQGVSRKGEITTLGRGGSDTTAVALAIALRAEKVEFYKDVEGIYTLDPNKFPDAQLLPRLSYDEAFSLAQNGAQVLHPRCVMLAKKNQMPLHVVSFFDSVSESRGTWVGDELDAVEARECIFEEESIVEAGCAHV